MTILPARRWPLGLWFGNGAGWSTSVTESSENAAAMEQASPVEMPQRWSKRVQWKCRSDGANESSENAAAMEQASPVRVPQRWSKRVQCECRGDGASESSASAAAMEQTRPVGMP
mmetsp:Transcript_57669/g.133124  ORF Transcript_57669/g.133124 Transcript_57669/m.133124 type:complete len:115 (+) Transcript_57669:657-1001(+)